MCSLPALYQKCKKLMYFMVTCALLAQSHSNYVRSHTICSFALRFTVQKEKKCQFWVLVEVPIMGHVQPFKHSLSPLSLKGEEDAISIQWKIKWNMQGTCFYFQTIILNLSNEEWVILHQHNPRLNHFIMWKPNHFNRPCSHRQGKKNKNPTGSKIAIKLYCCS